MKKYKIETKMLLYLTIFIIISCEKEETNPEKNRNYAKVEIIKGNNQTGYFGEILNDTIILKATSTDSHRIYMIKCEKIQGNGIIEYYGYNIDDIQLSIDSAGILKLNWRLGCNNTVQKVKFYLFVDSIKNDYQNNGNCSYYNEPSDTITINSFASMPHGWCRSCGCFDFFGSKILSFDNNTLYLVNYWGLYYSHDGGVNWDKVHGVPNWELIVDAQFNNIGWLYILTENNGICYSKDLKQWQYINSGTIDHHFPTAFLVEDSTLFVNYRYDGFYKTSNNGEFWEKLFVGSNSSYLNFITRHPNGNIYLYDGSDFWISNNSGYSWEKVNIDYKYIHNMVYDFKIDKDGYLYFGAEDAIISILDPITYQGEVYTFYEYNSSSQEVLNIQIVDNNVYFLVMGNPKPGIYSKLNNWSLLDIGFSKLIYNYYLKSNKTFLIISNDGLYYINQN